VGLPNRSRLPSLTAVALIGAALGDPLIESISNTGVFGRGYTDNNHLSIVPVLVLAVLFACEILAARGLTMWRQGARAPLDQLRKVASRMGGGSLLHDLPVVLGMQLTAVFLMENAEQIAVGGGFVGGTAWLGAPVAISLLGHVLVALGCTALLRRVMRTLLVGFASLISFARESLLLARQRGTVRSLARRAQQHVHPLQAGHARQIGGRAPPVTLLIA